jgi:hypothetical protein
MNASGSATGSFARNARLPLSDAQGSALRGQRSCEGTLTKGRKSLAAAAPVAKSAGSAADIRQRDAPQRPRAENPCACASARSARSEQTIHVKSTVQCTV